MNCTETKFVRACELRGIVSHTLLDNFCRITPTQLRVSIYPERSAYPDGMPRSFFTDKTKEYGLWYNLADLEACIRSRPRFSITVHRRLQELGFNSLAECCSRRRDDMLKKAIGQTDALRVVFPSVVDDYAMTSFGYKSGTHVRTLHKFLLKNRDRYTTDEFCIVRVPRLNSMDFAASTRFKKELWMTREAMQRLNEEPVIAKVRGEK